MWYQGSCINMNLDKGRLCQNNKVAKEQSTFPKYFLFSVMLNTTPTQSIQVRKICPRPAQNSNLCNILSHTWRRFVVLKSHIIYNRAQTSQLTSRVVSGSHLKRATVSLPVPIICWRLEAIAELILTALGPLQGGRGRGSGNRPTPPILCKVTINNE